ncbi:phosphatidylethanolamine N-methyltransferase isoform c [Mus musculus]|nr:phosphatidylethanolamine N-methyltransferase isoform c [Mus musculus]|eukprot:NP_001276943.1 phosphatidylethanolamine N-methyltransferase isoform c [Mus musculus]
MSWLLGYMDPTEPSFVAAVITIVFNPLFWNVVARWEQRTRKLSRAFGSPHLACYSLGICILLLNILRSHWHASPTGLLLTVLVAIVYVVALLYEEPFTAEIYRQKATRLHKRS